MLHPLLENFHFIRPLWLLTLFPLAGLLWAMARPGGTDNPWQRVIDARLLPLLMLDTQGSASSSNRQALWLLAIGWLIAALALADPTWARKPEPVFQSNAARVVVLSLADSMETADLVPNRLTQARFKVEDVLNLESDGQTGLVAYAGDAFNVSPLTRDTRTISALLKVLAPDLMPVQGSRADLGLLKASELLRHAGVTQGQVLLMADGVPADRLGATEAAAEQLKRDGYQVSVLGIGPQDRAALDAVAAAGGGLYRPITADSQALKSLLSSNANSEVDAVSASRTDVRAQSWQERGPLLVLVLLPVALLAFRRGWLLSIVLLVGFVLPPQQANAATWNDLWQRRDQQADKALAKGDYARAAVLSSDAERRGSAEYKSGHYQEALSDFGQSRDPQAAYNRGNALARLQRYPDAIAAYNQALKTNPGDEDAKANKAAVEALMKKRPQQQQTQQSSGQNTQDQKSRGQRSSSQQSQQGQQGQNQQQEQDGKAHAGGPPNGEAKAGPQTSATANVQPEQQAGKSFEQVPKRQAQGGQQDTQGQQAQQQPGTADPSQAADGSQAANKPLTQAQIRAQRLEGEEKLAAAQWLRAIPDDPGGLLRRKFLYQYRQRALAQQRQQQ